jgi:hypothetical protein
VTKFESKSHCKHGHALEGSNIYVAPDGRRRCRACRRRNARVSARQRAGNAPELKSYAKLKDSIKQRKKDRYWEAVEHLTPEQQKRLFYI